MPPFWFLCYPINCSCISHYQGIRLIWLACQKSLGAGPLPPCHQQQLILWMEQALFSRSLIGKTPFILVQSCARPGLCKSWFRRPQPGGALLRSKSRNWNVSSTFSTILWPGWQTFFFSYPEFSCDPISAFRSIKPTTNETTIKVHKPLTVMDFAAERPVWSLRH